MLVGICLRIIRLAGEVVRIVGDGFTDLVIGCAC
jgi:hypothetical protein